jgi:PAS domain S-box-containing protein
LQITDIAFDEEGRIIIGTPYGYSIGNGLEFECNAPDSISYDKRVSSLASSKGYIYVGTKKALYIFRPDGTQVSRLSEINAVNKVICTANETYVVCDNEIFYGQKNSFNKLVHPDLEKYSDFSTALFHNQRLYLATKKGQLLILKTNKKTKRLSLSEFHFPSDKTVISDLCIGKDNKLFLSCSNGIFEFDGIDFNKIKFPGSDQYYFTSISYNPISEKYWAGSWGGGAFEFDKISYRNYRNTGDLKDDVITDIYCDRYGNTWIGTYSLGLFQLKLGNIEIFTDQDGLKNPNVTSIYKHNDKLYFGTFNGVYVYDGIETAKISGTENRRFSSICFHAGGIYAISHDGVLYRINPYTDTASIEFSSSNLSEAMHICSFQGKMYIWCYNLGLFTIENKQTKKIVSFKEANNRNIYTSLAHEGDLFFGTSQGLVFFNGFNFIDTLTRNPNIHEGRINQILSYNKNLLIATNQNGLWKYNLDTDRYMYANSAQDKKNRAVQAIIQVADSSEYLIATRFGTMLVDFENNERIHSIFDDLIVLKINPGAIAHLGNEYFLGSTSGLIRFNDVALKRPRAPIKIYAHDFFAQIDQKKKPLKNLKKLEHEKGSFGFKVSAISFDEKDLRYRFRVKNKFEWSDFTKNREINISNLPPGNYEIEVQAISSNDIKSSIISIPVIVEHPFWMSLTFFFLVLGSFLLVAFGVLIFLVPKSEIKLTPSTKFKPAIYRSILITGGMAYPVVSYIDYINSPAMVDPQSSVSIAIGLLLLSYGLLSLFSEKISKYLSQATYLGYFIILSHLLLLTYTNQIISAHVIGVLFVIAMSAIVLEKFVQYLVFSIAIISVYFLIVFSVKTPQFDPSRALISMITMLIIIGLIITSRRSFFNKLSIGNSVLNLGDDIALVVNSRGKLIYSTSNIQENIGKSDSDLYEIILSKLAQNGKTINSIAFSESDSSFDLQFTKNREKIFYRLKITPTDNAYFLFNLYDITKSIELEKEKAMLSLVAEKSSSGIVISDANGRVEWCNKSMELMLGYEMAELKGKVPSEVLKFKKDFKLEPPKDNLKEGYIIALPHIHKNGSEVWLEIQNTPILDENNEIVQQVEIVNDITEKKRAEEELRNTTEQLSTLNLISQAIMERNDIEGALFKPLEEYFSKYSLIRITISTFNSENETVTFFFTDDKINRFLTNTTIPVSEISSYATLAKGEIYFVSDINEIKQPSATDISMLEDGIRSYFMYPLFSKNELLGSLNMSFADPDDINDQMMEEIDFFASGISVALNQVHLISQLNKERREIKDINKDLTDSISYAKKLQEAKLPDLSLLKSNFSESAVFYRPKEIVSGDFYYWTRKGDEIIFTASDCTGHGVPGAFMTILSSNLLDNIINEKGITDPGMVLSYLNAGVIEYFNKTQSGNWEDQIRDGLDLALASFNIITGELKVAQAKRPVILIKDNKLEIIKANGLSIGDIHNPNPLYESTLLHLRSGDAIFMFSDGPTDQFGGQKNKKYTVRRLINMIEEHKEKSIDEIINIFDEDISNYQKGYDQTDDMVLLGIRI